MSDYSHKQITPDYPIHDLIARRFSPRVFAEKPVTDEALTSLFEAARWAASSGNNQPWRFVMGRRGTAIFATLASCLNEGNSWAADAPILILGCTKLVIEREGRPPRDNRHAWYDLGLAVGNMSLQATAQGLYLHQMAGFDAKAAEQKLQIPEKYAAVVMMAAGYLGNLSDAPDDLRQKELSKRTREPQTNFVFAGWGETAEWLS
jgi:nitroreductase